MEHGEWSAIAAESAQNSFAFLAAFRTDLLVLFDQPHLGGVVHRACQPLVDIAVQQSRGFFTGQFVLVSQEKRLKRSMQEVRGRIHGD